jgi:hypothetical protein
VVGQDQKPELIPSGGPQALKTVRPSAAKSVLPVTIGVVVLFAIVVVVLLRTGVFEKSTSKSDVEVVVAMLTLLGAMIASAFTLIGALLKHSLDLHNARLAEDSERSRRLEAAETEARLRLETSIKAVELMTLADGAPSPGVRQAGALFVLGSEPLLQLDLALVLLDESWTRGAISASAAVGIIDRALRQGDTYLQSTASDMLEAHLDNLISADGRIVVWPSCAEDNWPMGPVLEARQTLFRTFVRVMSRRALDEWPQMTLNWFLKQSFYIRKTEENRALQCGVTLVLDLMLEWYRHTGRWAPITTWAATIDLDELKSHVEANLDAAESGVTEQVAMVVNELRDKWRSDGQARGQ